MIYIEWMEALINTVTRLINMIKITFTFIFPLNSTSLLNYTCVYIIHSDKM